MKKILLGLLILGVIAGAGAALDDPEQRVTSVLKDYIIAQHPAWNREDIVLTYKQAERTWESLRAYGATASVKVLSGMPDFRPVGNVIFPLQISDGEKSRFFGRSWRPRGRSSGAKRSPPRC
jgi:hypothetical protein